METRFNSKKDMKHEDSCLKGKTKSRGADESQISNLACPKKLVNYGLHEPCLLAFPPNITLGLVL